ncbi:WAT1-related protein At4g08290-like isoform X1 [Zingiber officinale]|uniref:WAT1-related protein At4g08290-like isoform X1 n=1 Tax=Zingiber officinale TaxID=94328 RepID=UPI001C4D5C47|nr:WAT1-related protein At4g08290-like isoform X1 [Zingiber officinale]
MATVKEYGVAAGMVSAQVVFATTLLLSRHLFTHGMSFYAFVLYRQMTSTLVISPIFFYINRRRRPCVRWKNVKQIFLLAFLIVTLNQMLHNAGTALTSSIFVGTMNNLIPSITFLLAYLLRLEELNIMKRDGQVKILGIMLGLGGAMVMTFFKGHHENRHLQQLGLNIESFPLSLVLKFLGQSGGNFILGAFIAIIGCSSCSAYLLYQETIIEEYPCKLSLSFLINLMGLLQCAVVSLILEKPSALNLQWNMQLLLIVCIGICMGAERFIIIMCVKAKGAVYVSAFNPLSTVIVAILEPLLLHEQLTWSSLTGMTMVIVGLYLYIWVKAKESPHDSSEHEDPRETWNTNCQVSSNQQPLLATTIL